jgi:hypothetical protein
VRANISFDIGFNCIVVCHVYYISNLGENGQLGHDNDANISIPKVVDAVMTTLLSLLLLLLLFIYLFISNFS